MAHIISPRGRVSGSATPSIGRGLFVRLENGSWLRIRVFSTEEMLERIRITHPGKIAAAAAR